MTFASFGAMSRPPALEFAIMSVVNSLRRGFAPIHPEGYLFVAGFVVATLILWWLWSPLGWLGLVATLWCAYFFRDPARVTPVLHYDGTPITARFIIREISSLLSALKLVPLREVAR